MRFGQLIEYKVRNIFIKKYTENETGRLVPDLLFYFKKALYKVKASSLQLIFNTFTQLLTQHTIKTSCVKLQTIDLEI